jgi:hypothetical protein
MSMINFVTLGYVTYSSGMNGGDEVKIKGPHGEKWHGVVTEMRMDSDPLGPIGHQVPGPVQMTLTIEITRFNK